MYLQLRRTNSRKDEKGSTRALGPGFWLIISQHKRRYLIERYPGHGIWMEERKGIFVLNFHFISTVYSVQCTGYRVQGTVCSVLCAMCSVLYHLLNSRKLIIRLTRDFHKLRSVGFYSH